MLIRWKLIFLLCILTLPLTAQRFGGSLAIEIKISENNVWHSFSSKDCMTMVDYKEGYFKFDLVLEKVFSKDGESDHQDFLNYVEGSDLDKIEFYGNFSPEQNYMLERPRQNVKGSFKVPNGEFSTELEIRTTIVGNDERRVQLLVEKQLDSPPLQEGRKVLFLIDGIINRLD